MTDLVVAAPVEPQRPFAAALHHLVARWRHEAAAPRIDALEAMSAHQMRDLGLDANHRHSPIGARLWSDWSSSPRQPFSL